MNIVVVTLDAKQMATATTVGARRFVECIVRNMVPKHGGPRSTQKGVIENHVVGALGEYAVARWVNMFWDIGKFGTRDVGGCIDVRGCLGRSGSLIVHPEDPDDVPFVLVHLDLPHCHLVGWLFGREAKQDKWWTDKGTGRPAFFVPPGELRPMADLLAHVTPAATA